MPAGVRTPGAHVIGRLGTGCSPSFHPVRMRQARAAAPTVGSDGLVLADPLPGDAAAGHRRSHALVTSIGPVQLIVLGFDHSRFRGEIGAELARLHGNDAVRVIDSLVVYKDAGGDLEVGHLDELPDAAASELGRVVGALVGLAVEGEPGLEAADDAADEPAGEQEAWDVLEDIPPDSAAALVLVEHHWAIPLRDAITRAGGFRIADGFISPLDLVEVGLVSAQEAETLHAIETGAT